MVQKAKQEFGAQARPEEISIATGGSKSWQSLPMLQTIYTLYRLYLVVGTRNMWTSPGNVLIATWFVLCVLALRSLLVPWLYLVAQPARPPRRRTRVRPTVAFRLVSFQSMPSLNNTSLFTSGVTG